MKVNNKDRNIHIAMMNTYNALTGKVDPNRVITSNIPVFAHHVKEELRSRDMRFVIEYFSSVEMYEICQELSNLYRDIFGSDYRNNSTECRCQYPHFTSYDPEVICDVCGGVILFSNLTADDIIVDGEEEEQEEP